MISQAEGPVDSQCHSRDRQRQTLASAKLLSGSAPSRATGRESRSEKSIVVYPFVHVRKGQTEYIHKPVSFRGVRS